MSRWFTLCALALIAAAFAFRPVSTPGPALRDFEAYWSAGAAWNAHADPYGRAIWNAERGIAGVDPTRDEVLPFVGPPATLLAWSILARVPYAIAAQIWFASLASAAVALVVVVVRASKRFATPWPLVSAAALALAFGPITSDIALGQVALIAFLAASIAALPLRPIARAVAAFVALFQPNVAFGLVSQLGRNQALPVILGGLAFYSTGALFSGWGWPVEYLERLLTHTNAERLSAIQITPAAIAHGAGMPLDLTNGLALTTAVVAGIATVVLWQRIADPFARFAAIAPLAPFVSSFFHEHDLVVAYAAAGWCALRTRGAMRALALGATLLVAVDWLGLAQRPTGIVQSALLATAAVCAFAALGQEVDWRGSAVALGMLAGLFAFAAWLAAAHPAPIWPDALGSFHAPATASVADVWLREQRRAGLLEVNHVWAFLRELSLLGCALLSLCVFQEQTQPRHAEAAVA